MEYHVGVEDMEPDNWVAYVYELPGCFSSARNQADAIVGLPSAIKNYFDWRRNHVRPILNPLPSIYQFIQSSEIKIDEVFVSYPAKEDPEYLVNAFFRDDLLPIDMSGTLQVLIWNRQDLLDLLKPLSPDVLNRPSDPRFGNIAGILKHIAWSERWYFERIGLVVDFDKISKNPFEDLETARADILAYLPNVDGNTEVVKLISEDWSPRKVVRRTLWHERDHINHISQILAAMK